MGEKQVVFQVGEGRYAIPLEEVVQIIRYESVTDVPAAPPFIDGVLNVGGDVVPVVNLRTRFSLPPAQINRKSRVIIVQKREARYGILVDAVREILDLDRDRVAVEAASVFGIKSEYIQGIAKIGDHRLVLLDIFKVLATAPEISVSE